jgi:hypothetical protein
MRDKVPENVLQDFLESLADADGQPGKRLKKVLTSYAELQYRLNGGGRCTVCNATVRHIIPVRAQHEDGSTAAFQCLCTRCLEAERAVSDTVTLTVGRAQLVYKKNEPLKTQKFRAYR